MDEKIWLTGYTAASLRGLLATGVILVLSMTFGCKKEQNQYVPPPPPKVTVASPVVQDVTEYASFTGQTAAEDSVEIRARVKGFLQAVHYQDGQLVKEGERLFSIDPREYVAALNQVKAEQLNAEAALSFAKNDLDRREKAYKERAISEVDLLRARSERDRAAATVAAAKAEVETAKLNLSYTRIKSPIAGRVSRRLVDVGNLVGADGATLLATVVSVEPIYVYFRVNEREVAQYLREINQQDRMGEKGEDTRPPVIELALSEDKGYPHHGVLDYFDNRVDADTGTIQARGVLPNNNHLLLPGFFAKIRTPKAVKKGALLVPDRVVGVDQSGRYLLTVDKGNVVQRREVTTGALVGGLRVIESGLEANERVVVKGILRARPGSSVTPITVPAVESSAGNSTAAGGAAPK